MLYIIMTNTARPLTSSFFLMQPSSLFLATVHAVIHIIDIQQEPSGMESESRRSSLSLSGQLQTSASGGNALLRTCMRAID